MNAVSLYNKYKMTKFDFQMPFYHRMLILAFLSHNSAGAEAELDQAALYCPFSLLHHRYSLPTVAASCWGKAISLEYQNSDLIALQLMYLALVALIFGIFKATLHSFHRQIFKLCLNLSQGSID